MEFKRAVETLVCVGIVALVSFSSLIIIPDEGSAYTPHDPIFITNDGGFTPANGVTGGSGTSSDPYVIEGWEIYARYPWCAIQIWNTDSYFIIRDLYLKQGGMLDGLLLIRASNATIENVIVRGGLNGIYVALSNNVIISDTTVSRSTDYGALFHRATNVTMTGNSITGSNKVNIAVWDSRDFIVTGNDASSSRAGMELSNLTNGIITGNTVLNTDLGIKVNSNSENLTIADNTISGFRIHAVSIFLDTTNKTTIYNNIMTRGGVYIYGRFLANWNTHTIGASNMINGKPVAYWKNTIGGTVAQGAGQVILANCSDVVVENQDLSDLYMAIEIGFSRASTIANSTIHVNFEGIGVFSSDGNTITNNTVHGQQGTGLYIRESDSNIVSENTVRDNTGYGINLFESANNTFLDNVISLNREGLILAKSDGNIMRNNVVMGNSKGVHLSSSENNRIFHNTIVGNFVQADDDDDMNEWDDGYPSGGNYWSDYNGVDDCSGPNQDICPDPDGKGDTPYIIDADSRDRYPLMTAPILPPPQPPTIIQANLGGANLENVDINWDLSLDDGMGFKSVRAYQIFRGVVYNPTGLGYQLADSLPNGTTTFTDYMAGEGDSSNYFYRVCATDFLNNISCSMSQAGKFTRPLLKGPNLVSIPLVQSDESIETVLQTVEFDKVWTYYQFIQEWRYYMTFKPYKGDFSTIKHGTAVWVNVTSDSDLTVAGIVPSTTTIWLRAGWNLVGFPSFNPMFTIGELKDETGASRVEGFDPSAPPYFLRLMTDWDSFQTGFGYWVWADSFSWWIVENS
jgi:parallel beta-helix repeat protein